MSLYRGYKGEKDIVVEFTSSLKDDIEIAEDVLLVMRAHVIALNKAGHITKGEAKKLISLLKSLNLQIIGNFAGNYEDIHEALEDTLIRELGEVGGWVGLGRSRNDHVATCLRLRSIRYLGELILELINTRKELIEISEKSKDLLMPSFTHLKPAQPTTFSHYLLAIEEELSEITRIAIMISNFINKSPLGSGAGTGVVANIDRDYEAKLLGFDGITLNTLYSTSSRNFLLEASFPFILLQEVMSRVSEDLIFMSSLEKPLIILPEDHVATSSLMPHKRNPVTLEIIRAKSKESIGNFSALLNIYNSLNYGYNLDLQEMSRIAWNIMKESIRSLKVLIDLIGKLTAVRDNMRSLIPKESTSADYVEKVSISQGKPFRSTYLEVKDKLKYIDFPSPEESIKLKSVKGSPGRIEEIIEESKKRVEEDLASYHKISARLKFNSLLEEERRIENEM
jgi:argininosuccinate lyase